MVEENLGEIYVKIKADVSGLERELADLRRKIDVDSKQDQAKLNFKAKFDASIAKLGISELQTYRQRLQKEFEKKLSLNVDAASLDRTRIKIASVDNQLKNAGNTAQSFGSKLIGGFAALGGITAFFRVIKESVDAAKESAIAQAQITKAVETTGNAAGFTAKQLFKMAEELQKLNAIDDDKILTDVTNNLLTFKNVSGDTFKRAQQAILDLNAVISKGEIGALTSQTIQLGKALNDPVQGISALTRVGISFTEEQKTQIKVLAESGNLFEAQSLILKEIEGQYGGQAEALAKATGGMQQFSVTIGNLLEKLGAPFLTILGKVATAISSLIDPVKNINEDFSEQKKNLDDLQKSVVPLLSRYDELKSKTSLNKNEQSELKNIILNVANAIPSAISAFNEYGNATDINRGKVEEFIKTEQKRLAVVNKNDIDAFNKKKNLAEQNKKLLEEELKRSLKLGTKTIQFSTAQGVIEREVKISDQDIKNAQKNIKAFQDEIDGYNAQLDVLSGKVDEVKPVVTGKTVFDTTAGDEILNQYQEQQQAIDQIKNKLRDTTLSKEQQIVLQKELNDLLSKQNSKPIKTNGDDKYIQDLLNSLDDYGNKIKLLQDELSKLGSGDIEKEMIIHAQIVDLNDQLDKAELEIIQKVNGIKPKIKIDVEVATSKKGDPAEDFKSGAIDKYYSDLKTKGEDYFRWKVAQNQKEASELAKYDPVLAKQLEIDQIKSLEQEYFDWRIKQWQGQAGLTGDIFVSGMQGISAGYDALWQSLADADISGAERIQAIWNSVKSSALQVFGEILKGYIQNAIQQAVVGDTFRATEIAKGYAIGGALAAAYTPAATLASIMSFGGASIEGLAALQMALGSSQAMAAVPGFAQGGDFIVPPGYPNDSYPMLVESGERVQVTPAGKTADSEKLFKVLNKKLDVLNKSLINKDFAPQIFNTMTLNGRTIAKEVASDIKRMQKEGRKF